MRRKIIINNSATAEIVGSILLMAIAVSMFSLIYLNVLSDEGPDPESFSTIVGKMEENDVVFEHRRGELIDQDSRIIFEVAGGSALPPIFIDNPWYIGGRLSFSPEEIDPELRPGDRVQIDGTIVDKESNSIVFWGRLQEGYIIPQFGRGGLWHFDEPFWMSLPGEVKDSSDNENHGRACNGAKIVVEDGNKNTDDTINNNCGYFDGFDDYVEVKSAYSLNFTDAITIEAWVKPLEEKSVLSNTILESLKFGFNPDLIHIYGDTYAIAARDTGGVGAEKPCVVFTFNITSDGTVSTLNSSIPNNRTYINDEGDKPDILQHAENDSLYLIAYESDTDSNGAICVVNITENGSITKLSGSNFEMIFSEPGGCFDPQVIHINNNVYAITYHSGKENKPGKGKIAVISCDIEGHLSKIRGFTFNNDGCYTPRITHVSGDVYAIAYRGELNFIEDLGVVTTISITPDGTSVSKINDLSFNNIYCENPYFINISGNIYAIAYQGSGGNPGNGILTTVSISSDGDTILKINDFVFASKCYEVIIHRFIYNKYFLIYTDSGTESSKGWLRTVEIESDGTIIDAVEPWEPEQITDPLSNPSDILHIGGRVFTLAYKGIAGAHGHPGHIMCLLIGEDPTPSHMRGIVRAGAATIYAQYKRNSNVVDILGCINGPDQLIVGEVQANEWYHIILTYDKSVIKLYAGRLEFDLELLGEIPYSEDINIPPNNLLFGNIFNGYLDEIAIFNRALSFEEITAHHANPGYFTEEPTS